MRTSLTRIATSFLSLVVSADAFAAARAWVSSSGTDSGTCHVATPCRTLQYAHDHVDAGGEIDTKDSGGYGMLNINKSIAVVADGVLATIGGVQGGYALNINDAAATDVISLRGLTINGFASTQGE